MGSKAKARQQERCGQFWCLIDEVTHEVVCHWACFQWRCPVCGPKREAEAMDMLRLRLEGWQKDTAAAPNFITLTCDPSTLPGWIQQGSDEEDAYLRECFGNVMRQLKLRKA